MTPELAVATRLLACTAVTTLVGARVYMLRLPQKGTFPAVRVARISGVFDQQLRGPDDLAMARVQVDAYDVERPSADAYATVSALADAIRGDGLGPSASGLWGWTGVVDGLRILNVRVDDSGADYEGDELRLIRIRQDFLVAWK